MDYKRFLVEARTFDGKAVSGYPVYDDCNDMWLLWPSMCAVLGDSIEPINVPVIDPESDCRCPSCHKTVLCDANGDMPDFCPKCGQRLMWQMEN